MIFYIIGIILLIILTIVAIFLHKNLYYWQGDYRRTIKAGFVEKQVTLPDGSVINYAEGPNIGPALLLIHGQTVAWQDYCRVLPKLSKKWHVFAVDCYGHGKSSHNAKKYSLKENGDDLIWFVNEVIREKTIVSGHSSGGILAAYVSAYGGELVSGSVLEDPPFFSTEPDYFEKSFAYQDSFKLIHEYDLAKPTECWEAYYLRHCLWGQLYMASSMTKIANYAQKYHMKHPQRPVQIFFMPESINITFLYAKMYDREFGEKFYDYTWHSGIQHEKLLSDIKIPTIFLHVKDMYSEQGILMAASSNQQADKVVKLIADCKLITVSGNHNIHRFNSQEFIDAVNQF